MPVLMYGSETMIWREKERSRIRAVQMDSPECTYKAVVQGDGVLQWFGHMERMENDRIAKRVYVGECW